jgi:hypothetical protein
MALNTHISIAGGNLMLNALLDVLNTGFIDIYDSTGTGQPAGPDTAVSTQVKLATCTLNATAFAAAAGDTKTANAIGNGTGLAVGTATWFRALKSDHTTAVIDGSAGTSGTDLVLNDAAITIGGTVSITSWVVTQPI